MAPPGMSPDATAYYIRTLEKTRATPEWKDYVRKFGLTEQWLTGAKLATFLKEEEEIYRTLIVELGLIRKK